MLTFDPKSIFNADHQHNETGVFFPRRDTPRTMPERVDETARMLRDTLERLHMFEKSMEDKYSDLMRVMTQDNVLFKDLIKDGWANFVSTVKAEINLFESAIQETVSLFENSTNDQIAEHLERIKAAELYMRENLNTTLDNLLHEMEQAGTLTGVIESDLYTTPERFGATGDGVTDDTKAVQDGFAYAAENGIPLRLTRTYKISNVHFNASDTVINGSGKIIGDIFAGGPSAPVTGLVLDGFTIEGTIFLRRLRLSVLRNLRFKGSAENCITRDTTINVGQHQIGYIKITGCTMETGQGFMYLPFIAGDDEFPYNDIEIAGCTANPVQSHFILAQHLDGAKIAENYVQYYDYNNNMVKYTAIDLDFTDWVNIQNNTIFETGAHGIMLNNSRHFNIVGNTLGWNGENYIAHGVYIAGGWNGGQLQKGVIANNVISQPSGNAIHVDGGGFIEINANVCRFTYQPVYMGKSASNVTEGAISSLKHYAVGYDDVASDLVISNNVSYGAGYRVNNPNLKHNILNNYTNDVGIINVERIKIDTTTDATLDTLGASAISLKPTGARNITTLNGEQYGRKVTLYSANNEGTVIKSGAGNITLHENKDFAMKENSTLVLWYVGNGWVELSRSY